MPRYSKHTKHFKVKIVDNDGQMRVTVPKPLYDMLSEKKKVEGKFKLTNKELQFSPLNDY